MPQCTPVSLDNDTVENVEKANRVYTIHPCQLAVIMERIFDTTRFQGTQ